MIRTSIVPTIFNGGYLKNVIPSEARGTVDIRALASEDPEELFSRLKRIMNEPNVDLTPHPVTRPAHNPSSLDSDVFVAFEKVLTKRAPQALILPRMSTGATDSAQLRAAGIESYGYGPGKPLWDLAGGIHGKDEYLYVKPFQDYVEILYDVVREVAGK
jgi:acetylornithine deacetylase/succinyl-diaminopimelate desuccinylase-like protein